MNVLTEADVINIMRDEYRRRLIEAIEEADVFDDRGNLLIAKDLKVKHKKSQYEYTVDDVFTDPNSGKLKIALRLPDEPRIDPPGTEGIIADTPDPEVLGEDDYIISFEKPGENDIDEDELVFVVDQAEFEKDYEVK